MGNDGYALSKEHRKETAMDEMPGTNDEETRRPPEDPRPAGGESGAGRSDDEPPGGYGGDIEPEE
jgi:hypothetical protein